MFEVAAPVVSFYFEEVLGAGQSFMQSEHD